MKKPIRKKQPKRLGSRWEDKVKKDVEFLEGGLGLKMPPPR